MSKKNSKIDITKLTFKGEEHHCLLNCNISDIKSFDIEINNQWRKGDLIDSAEDMLKISYIAGDDTKREVWIKLSSDKISLLDSQTKNKAAQLYILLKRYADGYNYR